MEKVKKIGLIAVISLFSVFLLVVFVMVNFPYEAVIRRIDNTLARRQGASLTTADARYRFPFTLLLDDIRYRKDDGTLDIQIDRLAILLRLLSFSRAKTLQIDGSGLDVKSDSIDLSKVHFTLSSSLLLPLLREEFRPDAIRSLSFRTEGMRIDRVFISGFEFTSFKVPVVDIVLRNEENDFLIERGLIKSNLFSSEMSGSFGLEKVDGKIILSLTGEFYRQYSNLKTLVDSITDNGKLTLTIRGSTNRPDVKILKG